MISDYIDKRLKEATYKLLEDGTYFGEIPSLKGVWSEGKTLEACRAELQEVLEDWLVQRLRHGETIPGFDEKIEPDAHREYA